MTKMLEMPCHCIICPAKPGRKKTGHLAFVGRLRAQAKPAQTSGRHLYQASLCARMGAAKQTQMGAMRIRRHSKLLAHCQLLGILSKF